ncbi:MAG TPA: siroheme synthase [Sphingomonas sp.]|nr:siroheme synthase [Sphingomonas sp.]
MHSLPVFVRLEGRPVILIGAGPGADAKRRLLERAGATVVGEAASAQLAIVVDDDAAVARLKARGVLVNAVDRPDLCDFTLPAIVDRDPVLVAIGTGGASAGLAAALRQRIETMLPAESGALADELFAARAQLRARWPEADERRHAVNQIISNALATGALNLDAVPAQARRQVEALSQGAGAANVVRVAIASDDPDDLTLRAARLLGQADRVYHAPNIAPAILDRARADAPRIPGVPPADAEPGLTLVLEHRDG